MRMFYIRLFCRTIMIHTYLISDFIEALYKRNNTFLSAPHVVLDKTFIRSSDLVHLLFKEVMCGINDSFESNI